MKGISRNTLGLKLQWIRALDLLSTSNSTDNTRARTANLLHAMQLLNSNTHVIIAICHL